MTRFRRFPGPGLFVLILTCLASPARAQWVEPLDVGGGMIWGGMGFQGDLGGSITSSGIGVIDGLPAEIDANSWGERYDTALRFRIGGAYNVTSRSQVFGTITWEQSEADTAAVGLVGGEPLIAKFSDYQGWGLDFGYRHFIVTDYVAKPFVSAAIGFKRIQNITVDLTAPALTALEVPLYDDSVVPSWRFGGGVLWDVNGRWGVQVTADIEYSGVLSDTSGIGTIGFERINDVGNRWTLPILGSVYVKF